MDDADTYTGWSYRPTREEVRRECERDEYRYGSKTHAEGGVLFVELSRGEIVAEVRGDFHNEAVHLDDSTGRYRCTCRNSAWISGHCRHVIAVLLYMAENMDDIEDAEHIRLDSTSVLLERVPLPDLRDFVADYMRNDPVMYSDFLKRFKMSDTDVPRNYERLVKNIYGSEGNRVRGVVRFGPPVQGHTTKTEDGDARPRRPPHTRPCWSPYMHTWARPTRINITRTAWWRRWRGWPTRWPGRICRWTKSAATYRTFLPSAPTTGTRITGRTTVWHWRPYATLRPIWNTGGRW